MDNLHVARACICCVYQTLSVSRGEGGGKDNKHLSVGSLPCEIGSPTKNGHKVLGLGLAFFIGDP